MIKLSFKVMNPVSQIPNYVHIRVLSFRSVPTDHSMIEVEVNIIVADVVMTILKPYYIVTDEWIAGKPGVKRITFRGMQDLTTIVQTHKSTI